MVSYVIATTSMQNILFKLQLNGKVGILIEVDSGIKSLTRFRRFFGTNSS